MNYMNAIGLKEYQYLLEVAQKLTAEQDIARLCAIILDEALQLSRADGGTLYLAKGQGMAQVLEFALVRNLSLKLTSASGHAYPAVPLYQADKPNLHHVASACALKKQLINIENAYQNHSYDFTGTQEFDQRLGYRTQSVLALPLCTETGELIGVLQLLNAQDAQGLRIPFDKALEPLILALSRFAAIALQKQQALHDQKALLVALAGAPNAQKLLERILDEAQSLTGADGGTL